MGCVNEKMETNCLFGDHWYLGMGPLMSRRCPGSRLCMCSDMGPSGYFLMMKSTVPFWSTSLMGVYGRMTGFFISGPLYLVMTAAALG